MPQTWAASKWRGGRVTADGPAHDAEVLAAAEATEGGGLVAGGDDDVVEVAAHGGDGVDAVTVRLKPRMPPKAEIGSVFAGAAVGLDLRLGVGRQAAGHGVLDDRDGDVVEVIGGGPGGLQVEDVDVGELEAVELLDAGKLGVA